MVLFALRRVRVRVRVRVPAAHTYAGCSARPRPHRMCGSVQPRAEVYVQPRALRTMRTAAAPAAPAAPAAGAATVEAAAGRLLRWLQDDRGGHVACGVEVAEFMIGRGLGYRARARGEAADPDDEHHSHQAGQGGGRAHLEAGAEVVLMPAARCISSEGVSAQSMGAAQAEALEEMPPTFRLMLALLQEAARCDSSEFGPQIRAAPRAYSSVYQWGASEMALARKGPVHLRHGVEHELERVDVVWQYYGDHGLLPAGATKELFAWCFATVASRAFDVDLEDGTQISLDCPVLSMMNHSHTPNCRVVYYNSTGEVGACTTRRVAPGEQLFIEYVTTCSHEPPPPFGRATCPAPAAPPPCAGLAAPTAAPVSVRPNAPVRWAGAASSSASLHLTVVGAHNSPAQPLLRCPHLALTTPESLAGIAAAAAFTHSCSTGSLRRTGRQRRASPAPSLVPTRPGPCSMKCRQRAKTKMSSPTPRLRWRAGPLPCGGSISGTARAMHCANDLERASCSRDSGGKSSQLCTFSEKALLNKGGSKSFRHVICEGNSTRFPGR